MTTTSKDLFLSILSLDAYNHGYQQGLAGLSDGRDWNVGGATLDKISDVDPRSAEVRAGFFAIAYDTPNGKVIFYRGTDNNGGYWSAPSGSDAWNGYGMSIGSPLTTQGGVVT